MVAWEQVSSAVYKRLRGGQILCNVTFRRPGEAPHSVTMRLHHLDYPPEDVVRMIDHYRGLGG